MKSNPGCVTVIYLAVVASVCDMRVGLTEERSHDPSELTGGIPGNGPLLLDEIRDWLGDSDKHVPIDLALPIGLAAGSGSIKGIAENPLTRAKIELGRQLFFDARLSADKSVSCATCHAPQAGFAASTRFGIGTDGQAGNRNAPAIYNRIFSQQQFWDGRAASLEEQALGPITNTLEMDNTPEACVELLSGIKGYRIQFESIFGDVTMDAVGQAIASFERALLTGASPLDFYERAQPFLLFSPADFQDDPQLAAVMEKAIADAVTHPMNESALRGRALFYGKAQCSSCHGGANLTDEQFHNIGVGMEAEKPDLGRFVVTGEDKDRGAFKTPTIRNVTMTAPYMHDGSQKTLDDVVEFYAKGGTPNPYLDPKIKKLSLTDQDKMDLVEFMKACTGPLPAVATGRLPRD